MNKTVFGQRYRLTEQIGTGGMAVVYKAQDEVLGRTVALKVLLPQYAAEQSFAARFRQEAQAAANLQNPYIVNMYDWGCDEGIYYIAMEYVRGIDLKTAIKQRGAIHRRKVAEIAAQVCSALATAHGYDIIHRDIKSQNIMVLPDGNAKVMDFGIARAGDCSMTEGSAVLGTAHYVSPEQAQGLQLGAASDLYSLGIVMYEAATGQLPFVGEDIVAVAMKQVTELPIPPSQLNPAIDSDFERIVMKALEKDPRDRFASANEMKAALNDYLAGRPVILDADATTIIPTPATPFDYNNGYGADATTVMPVGAFGTPGSMNGGEYDYARNIRSNDEIIPKKRDKKPLIFGIAAAIVVIAAIVLLIWQPWNGNMVTVPDLTGKTQKAAEAELEIAELTVGEIGEEYSDDVPEGCVVSQDPEANSSVKKGSAISFVLSLGAADENAITVPDLLGKSASEAESLLTAAGLVCNVGDAVYDESYDPGLVAYQSPSGGSQVPAGSTITYCLSLGEKTVEIPEVTGKTRSTAKTTLEELNLNVTVTEEYSDSVAEGDVISVSPSAGSKVNEGSSVTLTVSKGKKEVEKVSVPDVTGLSQSKATSTLEKKGFTVKVTTTKSTSSTKGQVLDQDPAEGEEVESGATITITVGDGTESDKVSVPNVVGKTEAEATEILEDAGLVVKVKQVDSASSKQGLVVSQSPAASKKVSAGSTITLSIGNGEAE